MKEIAEQLRLRNLILLATYDSMNEHGVIEDEGLDLLRVEALNALVGWVPHGADDEHPEIRADVAEALGLNTY